MTFVYRGTIPASKSLMNRALICGSFAPELRLVGDSSCDDVARMRESLAQPIGTPMDCGAAGTTFRFLALRAARRRGRAELIATERLLSRPQQDLLDTLARLGARVSQGPRRLAIESDGWQGLDRPVRVRRDVSSQFASALVLNAWDLERDLVVEFDGVPVSEGYFAMTLDVVRRLGMEPKADGARLTIPAGSRVRAREFEVESDLSSAFAVAAFAALGGEATFERFPIGSAQPDVAFVDALARMGAEVSVDKQRLIVRGGRGLRGIEADLGSCPDLFPVLATLCAFASTPSRLYGAPQLAHKESDRVAKIAELLQGMGVEREPRADGMLIRPSARSRRPFVYDADHDHRLAFAAALARAQGVPVEIRGPEVVAKSFPEFWDVIARARGEGSEP